MLVKCDDVFRFSFRKWIKTSMYMI